MKTLIPILHTTLFVPTSLLLDTGIKVNYGLITFRSQPEIHLDREDEGPGKSGHRQFEVVRSVNSHLRSTKGIGIQNFGP